MPNNTKFIRKNDKVSHQIAGTLEPDPNIELIIIAPQVTEHNPCNKSTIGKLEVNRSSLMHFTTRNMIAATKPTELARPMTNSGLTKEYNNFKVMEQYGTAYDGAVRGLGKRLNTTTAIKHKLITKIIRLALKKRIR